MKVKRFKGFVVGSDQVGPNQVWKVRVKDSECKLDGEKLIVASVHDNIALASGLDVDFLLGHNKKEGSLPRAVDVYLSQAVQAEPARAARQNRTPSSNKSIALVETELKGVHNVFFSGYSNIQEVLDMLNWETGGEEKLIRFAKLTFEQIKEINPNIQEEEFDLLIGMSVVDNIRDAIEAVISAFIRFGEEPINWESQELGV